MTIERIEEMLEWLREGTQGPYRADADHYDDFWVHGIAGSEWIATIGQSDSPTDADARNIAALLNSAQAELEALRRIWIDSKYSGDGTRLQVRLVIQKIVDIKYKAFKEANGEQL